MIKYFAPLVAVLAVGSFTGSTLATPTENFEMRALKAPGPMTIDGKSDDWNLSGGLFVCHDVETLRDSMNVWIHLAYDADYLYVLARFADTTPLDSHKDPKAEFGWNADCLQFRLITHPGQGEREWVSHWACYQGKDGSDVAELVYDRGFTGGPKGPDAQERGVKQEFRAHEDGAGYTQEIAIPWELIERSGQPIEANDRVTMTVQPWWGGGQWGVSAIDLFNPYESPNRTFSFSSSRTWGSAVFVDESEVQPGEVRLADSRTFPIELQDGKPIVDWTGVDETGPAGFLPITFEMPEDGHVSLIVRDGEGMVRNLVNGEFFTKGKHEIKWDGLANGNGVGAGEPGQPVQPGDYTWTAIRHEGIGLRLRGWASGGGQTPWATGPTYGWGGDMGAPRDVDTEGDYVALGWHHSEAGKALVVTDLEGTVLWRYKRGGFGGARRVAIDDGVVYVADGSEIYKKTLDESATVLWADTNESILAPANFWGKTHSVDPHFDGLDVHDDVLYVSYPVNPELTGNDVADWRVLMTKVLEADAEGETVSATALDALGRRERQIVREWIETDEPAEKMRNNRTDLRRVVMRAINGTIEAAGKAAEDDAGKARARQAAAVRAELGDALLTSKQSFVAMIDADSGELQKTIDLPDPGWLHAVSDELVYVLSEGEKVLALNPKTGKTRTVVEGLKAARSLAVDEQGAIYVGINSPAYQVAVFSPEGKPLRTIGQEGGRPALGKWQQDGMRNLMGMSVDRLGRLWVTESTMTPKRISMWDAKTGDFEREFFGSTHYGASGGTIDPDNPNRMVGVGAEWEIDPETGRARVLGVFDTEPHASVRYAYANGRKYLIAVGPSYIGGRKDWKGARIFERLGDGEFVLRSTILSDIVGRNQPGNTTFWADANDDQQVQPEETQTLTGLLDLGGYYEWGQYFADDLTAYAIWGETSRLDQAMTLRVDSFTECGAPVYDIENAEPRPAHFAGVPSPDQKFVLSEQREFALVDVASGEKLWSYPAPWWGVHGSHKAPPSAPGLIRGAFGSVGSAKLPEPVGTIWAINSNVGEWHILTEDGYYLTRLFEGDGLKQVFPEKAVPGAVLDQTPPGAGGEDFGGRMIQGKDGKVYIQAGKTSLWNVAVVGLDTVKPLGSGSIQLDAEDVTQAKRMREKHLQRSTGQKRLGIVRLTPEFTGSIRRDFDGGRRIQFQKGDQGRVDTVAAWDEDNLYLGFEVQDATPWQNAADEPAYLYVRGDTIDLQLATEPGAEDRGDAGKGDLRLSIGSLNGQPAAALFRPVAEDRNPHTFSSGIVREYIVDSVTTPDSLKYHVSTDEKRGRYVVEVAIPWDVLGVEARPGLELRGDLGVTFSTPDGSDVGVRSYWNNQQTGIVSDEVYELKLQPQNWGNLVLE